VTTAGFVSAARDDVRQAALPRLAAGCSMLLAAVLLRLTPLMLEMAGYVAVLALALAAAALTGGAALWWRATPVSRLVTGTAAAAVLVGELLQASLGFPGARGVPVPPTLSLITLVLATAVVALLLADATQRRPQPSPDHPYAL
jgi:hypothetical protein